MVLQVAAHPGQCVHERHTEPVQDLPGADAGELQKHGRGDGTRGQNDLLARRRNAHHAACEGDLHPGGPRVWARRTLRTPRTASTVPEHSAHMRVGHDGERGVSRERGFEVPGDGAIVL